MSRALFDVNGEQYELNEQCTEFRIDGKRVSAREWDRRMEAQEFLSAPSPLWAHDYAEEVPA